MSNPLILARNACACRNGEDNPFCRRQPVPSLLGRAGILHIREQLRTVRRDVEYTYIRALISVPGPPRLQPGAEGGAALCIIRGRKMKPRLYQMRCEVQCAQSFRGWIVRGNYDPKYLMSTYNHENAPSTQTAEFIANSERLAQCTRPQQVPKTSLHPCFVRTE